MEFVNSISLLIIVLLIPKLRKAFFVKAEKGDTNKKRHAFFDFAKGVAITAVIVIHSVYIFEQKFPDFNPYFINSINNVSRFAVGFFFISSGALLTSGLTAKKMIRVFAPYIVASVAVGIFSKASLDLIVGGIIRGDLLPPYYFIPVLFQFYLLFPIISKFKYKKYFLPVALLISYVFYPTPSLTYIGGVHTFGPFLFLFAFGIAAGERFKKNTITYDINPYLITILIYVVLQFMLPAHYYNSRFFFAPAMFALLHFAWVKVKTIRNITALQTFGKLSLWIYLVHFSMESFLVNTIQYNFSYPVYFYLLIISVLTVVGSGVAAGLFEKLYSHAVN
jgi:surface polysaccharide O-acyltransferase-like enzyme